MSRRPHIESLILASAGTTNSVLDEHQDADDNDILLSWNDQAENQSENQSEDQSENQSENQDEDMSCGEQEREEDDLCMVCGKGKPDDEM